MSDIFRHSSWNDTVKMKWIIPIFLYTSTLSWLPGYATLLDPLQILHLAEINDSETLCHSFDGEDNISIQEAQQFLIDTFAMIQSQYPSDISLRELKGKIIQIIKNSAVDQYSFKKLEPIICATINQLIPDDKLLTMVRAKSPLEKSTSEIEVPGCVVFGTTEIVCGVLLCLTPFRSLSIPLIGDGLRRMGNAVEEKDKELRKHPERQYHPHRFLL